MGRFKIVDIATLPDSGVSAGSYTTVDLTVNSQGIITAISNGTVSTPGINDLTDVVITAASTGEIIQFDGADWVNVTLDINLLSDVTITGVGSNEILQWNGSAWINRDLATAGILAISEIGTSVQAWDAQLDGLAAIDTSIGLLIQTAAATFTKRSIAVTTNSGITITNGDGVSGNPTLDFDITDMLTTSIFDLANDLVVLHDTGTGTRSATIQDLFDAADAIVNVTTVGSGADTFKQISNQVIELRSISSGNNGIVIGSTTDDVTVSVSTTLLNLHNLVPVDNNFIVGTAGSTWAVETPSQARTSLGLGDMALESAADYLLLAGGTMAGDINMNSNAITGLSATPTLGSEATSKDYVDTLFGPGSGPGAGLVQNGSDLDIVCNDGSIIVAADEISLDTSFTDALYHTQTELNSTTGGTEGASLIGTDTKTGLNNATDVETALTHINTELPHALTRFSLELTGTWNLDVGAPTVTQATVNDVEVARFPPDDDVAIYRDFMLPPDFDTTRDLTLYISIAKETATADDVVMALATQHQRVPGFSADVTMSFNDNDTAVHVLSWTITASGFQALDVVSLRLSRLGSNIADDHATGADFFSAYLIQD